MLKVDSSRLALKVLEHLFSNIKPVFKCVIKKWHDDIRRFVFQFDSVNCSEDEDEEVVVIRPEEISSRNSYSPSMLRLLAQIQNVKHSYQRISKNILHQLQNLVWKNNSRLNFC